MKPSPALALLLVLSSPAGAAPFYDADRQMMICHRTANRDAPENTLESLEESALLGCDIVELDIRRTLDGELMLLHDGPIDRVSAGTGDVERMLSEEFALYDAGAWMNRRFAGYRHPRFDEAIRLSKRLGLKLMLDHKSQGITRQVYDVTKAEGMLEQVRFGGTARDIREIDPSITPEKTASWLPGMTRADVDRLRADGAVVIASFSANNHELNLSMMREAVAAGVNAINTDNPRIAADALGRPVEARALALRRAADSGDSVERAKSLLKLAKFRDFELTPYFVATLADPDPAVSRAAAVALVQRAEAGTVHAVLAAGAAANPPPHWRANQAWAVGMLGGQGDHGAADWLLSRLGDSSREAVYEALFALSRLPKGVAADRIRPQLESESGLIAGAAALALARHAPQEAERAIPVLAARLLREIYATWSEYAEPAVPGSALAKARTTFERPTDPANPRREEQTARATDLYGGYHKTLQAMASLDSPAARAWLHAELERDADDFSNYMSYIAGYQLWGRPDADRLAGVLAAEVPVTRDRAEWTLVKSGRQSAPALRQALSSSDRETRLRAARALGWVGDEAALPLLEKLEKAGGADAEVYAGARRKIGEVAGIVGAR